MMTENVELPEVNSASEPAAEINFRLVGLGILGLGLVLLACFVGWPVYQAHSSAKEFTIFKKLIGLGVFAVVTGINGIVFGKRAISWIPSGDENVSDIKFTTWLMLAVNGGIAVYAYILLEGYLDKLGYQIERF